MLEGTISPPTPFVGATVKAVPLHVVVGLLLIDGLGFTVTVMVKVDPGQLPDRGVTV